MTRQPSLQGDERVGVFTLRKVLGADQKQKPRERNEGELDVNRTAGVSR